MSVTGVRPRTNRIGGEMSDISVGTTVRVKPEFDIPPMFRNGPSTGEVESFLDAENVVVIVDGKAVPYALTELEAVEDSA